MAEDFLREASCIRSSDPVIMHERGSYYYRYNKFRSEFILRFNLYFEYHSELIVVIVVL